MENYEEMQGGSAVGALQGASSSQAGGGGEVRGGVRTLDRDADQVRSSLSSSVPTVPFNGESEQYSGWRTQMKALLYYQELWDVVDKPLKGSAQPASVIGADDIEGIDDLESVAPGASAAQVKKASRAYLILMCSQRSALVLAQLEDVPMGNAHEVWKRLESYFERNTEANRQHLMASFYQIAQGQDESVAQYSARVKKGVMALASLKEKISPSTMRYTFINGLLPVYGQLRSMLPLLGGQDFEATVHTAMAEESRLQIDRARGVAAGGHRAQESAHAAVTQGRRGDAGPCWRCGKVGHVKADCTQPPPICGGCGKRGHTAAQCWRGKKSGHDGGSHQGSAHHGGQSAQQSAGAKQAAAMAASVEELALAAGVEQQPGQGAVGVKATAVELQGWMLDAGASKHFATEAEKARLEGAVKNDAVSIRVANGDLLQGATEGNLKVKTAAGAVIKLVGVLSHPKMSRNLMSVSAICATGASVLYTKDKAEVFDKHGHVMMEAPRRGGVYVVETVAHAAVAEGDESIATSTATAAEEKQRLWHCRLGHPAESSLKELLAAGAVEGLEGVSAKHGDGLCSGCMEGKATRVKFGRTAAERTKATRVLGRVHADVCGPLPPSLAGSRYMLLLVDEFSRMFFGFALARKSDAAGKIVEWSRAAVATQGVPLVEFHSDGGGEFISRELQQFFQSSGVTATTTLPHTPQHNGIAERANRTVLETTLAELHHAGAHQSTWAEAMQAAIYTRNRAALRVGMKETPEGLWLRHETAKPSVRGLRVWGCDAWVTKPSVAREDKLDSKATVGMFVGYDEKRHGYRVLDVNTRKVVISRDVRFDETSFKQCAAMVEDEGGEPGLLSFNADMERLTFANELKLVQRISLEEHVEKMKAAAAAGTAPHTPPATSAGATTAPDAAPASAAPIQQQHPVDVKRQELLMQKYVEHSAAAGGDGEKAAALVQPQDAAEPPQVAEAPPQAPGQQQQAAEDPPLRRSGRIPNAKPPSRYEEASSVENLMAMAAEAVDELNGDPSSYEEAVSGPDAEMWAPAIEDELKAHRLNGTWVTVVRPAHVGKRVMGCKWVFRRKRDSSGAVVRWKARLVAQGFSQHPDSFGETFAPVLHYKSLRLILALVATLDLELKQLDVPTAFLNATCKEEIFMKVPAGVEAGANEVCLLKKTIYGIKQAPREWNKDFNDSIVALGYARCSSDTCVYVKQSRAGKAIIIPVFVDDAFPACATEDLPEMQADLEELMKKYRIPSIKDADVVLGMRITRDRQARTLLLDQELFAKKLLVVHRMENCNSAATPEAERERDAGGSAAAEELQQAEDESAGPVHFAAVTGGLSYLAASTRPDITHAIKTLAQAVSAPNAVHWLAAKRVLRYLKGTHQLGLKFGGGEHARGGADGEVTLAPSFCDADWAGDRVDRRSTTGYVVKVNGSTISWASKRQTTVALSSAEAEYMAAGAAVQELLWVRALLREMGFEQKGATVLLCDNQAAMAIASNDVHHARTKHIDIRHHFIREHVAAGTVRLQYVPTTDQEADILTKPLGRVLFCKLRERVLGMRC